MLFNIKKSKIRLATLVFMIAAVGLICVSAPAYADTPIVRCPAKGFDFNTATSTELQQLSGIGAATATNIINARPFSSMDDLTRVSGIAATTLANYKNQCNVSTDVTLQYWPGQVSIVTAANYYSDQICDLTPVTRDGYIFLNWTYVDGSSSSADIATNCTTVAAAETQSFVFAGDHTIFANWQAAQYTVNFDTLGGDVLPDTTVTFGETYDTLPTPIKSGYDFVGWYLDANFTTSVDANTIVATPNDHILYAK